MTEKNRRLLPVVVTARQMAAIDQYTIETVGIPGIVLMENAGVSVVHEIQGLLGKLEGKQVVILCGKGNNGGDGLVVARHLLLKGAQVTTFLFGAPGQLKGDARRNYEIYTRLGGEVLPLEKAQQKHLDSGDLLVDAILGTGVQGPLKSPLNRVVRKVNLSNRPVVAIDLPTGMNADSGEVYGDCVRATVTVTMAHIKRGLLFYPGKAHAGRVVVADIGIPTTRAHEQGLRCFQVTAEFVHSLLPERPGNTYKNKCGNVFLLAGSAGLTGAAALSSEAVLRSGAGMSMLGIPESLNAILEQKLTEVMTFPLPETDNLSVAFSAKDDLKEKLDWADVLVIGPGISTHAETCRLVRDLLQRVRKTVVLDADGINCLQGTPQLLRKAAGDVIITPHPGELARLTGQTVGAIAAQPVESAKGAARNLDVIVVLKTAPTVIAAPDGEVFINSTGNPGMATAGMGDVLTGVIAGLSAQGVLALESAVAGVFVHGLAGDLARDVRGEFGMIAGDVLKRVPDAILQLRKR